MKENQFELRPFFVLEIEREHLLQQTLQKIAQTSPDDLRKKLRVAFKYVLNEKDAKNPQWLLVGQAAYAAHAQGFAEFWDYQKRLLKTKSWDRKTLMSFARKESLDLKKFNEDLMLKRQLPTVNFEIQEARKLGFKDAAGFVVNGELVKNATLASLKAKIDASLAVWDKVRAQRKVLSVVTGELAAKLKADSVKAIKHKKAIHTLSVVAKSGQDNGKLEKSLKGIAAATVLAELKKANSLEKKMFSIRKLTAKFNVKRSPIWGRQIAFLQRYNLDTGRQFSPPTHKHWMGTDRLGRDIFVRTLVGVHIAFKIGIVTAIIACFIGLVMGSLSGYFGGWVDIGISWIYSVLSAIPYILLLILIAAIFKKAEGMLGIYVAFGIGFWIGPARMIRGEVFKLKALEYVQAARAIGLSEMPIFFKHIIPNTLHLVFVYFSLIFVGAVKSEVILSFLGLGVKGFPSWGRMISDAKSEILTGFWWQMIAASVALFILVYAFNVLTDALQDALDPKHTR